MKWQTDEGDISLQETLRLCPIPVRVAVPMEEQEARASRFVSQLAGDTEKPKPLNNSRLRLRWQRRVLEEERLRLREQG